MLTTAAGTIRPSQLLIIGAGVAGTAGDRDRPGAWAPWSRPTTCAAPPREQVKSLGAKFVDTGVSAEGSGGYARAKLTAEEKASQQEVLDARIAAGGRRDHDRIGPRAPGTEDHLARRSGTHAPRDRWWSTSPPSRAAIASSPRLARSSSTTAVKVVGAVNLPGRARLQRERDVRARNLYNFLKPAPGKGWSWRSTGATRCSLSRV